MEDLARQMGIDAATAHFAATGQEPASVQVRVETLDEISVWLWVLHTGIDMTAWCGEYEELAP